MPVATFSNAAGPSAPERIGPSVRPPLVSYCAETDHRSIRESAAGDLEPYCALCKAANGVSAAAVIHNSDPEIHFYLPGLDSHALAA